MTIGNEGIDGPPFNPANVSITGGTISGVNITAKFTTSTNPASSAATTTAIVDANNGVVITTNVNNTQTLANPTAATVKYFTVINNDTSSSNQTIKANGVDFVLTPGEGQCFLWDGSAWGPTDLGITEIPVIVSQGGTGRVTGTTAYSLVATGTTATGVQQTLANGATTEVLVGGGASALPVWTTATGSGAPVRATSPTLVTPLLGTPTNGDLRNCTGYPGGDGSFWGIKNLRLIDVHAGDATRVIVNPSAYNIPILIGEHWHVMTAGVDVDSVDDLDTGALAAGTDYYIYACTDGTTLSFKVSANATNPTGFDAAHCRKIGGFHTLCVAVGAISGHPLTDYAVKDILPASIWDLKHRAKTLVNVGLVYDSKIQRWVYIYLASGTGANTTSVNGGTISDTRNHMDFVDDGLAVGMRLLTDTEFTSIATGSNEETNITGSADPGTTSGHVDTAGRRMISNIGCEDCCGVVWQWLQDQAYIYSSTTGYWGNLPGGKGHVYTNVAADPGAPEMDNSDAGSDTKLIAGGSWTAAAICGSRSRSSEFFRWYTYASFGARFAVEPL